MSYTAILAEKPSQAKSYAEAFEVEKRDKSSITIKPCETFKNGAIITWGIGHLVSLKLPGDYDEKYKRWNLRHLPIIPDFSYKVIEGKKQHFSSMSKILKNADMWIIATDIDREGELIARLIFNQLDVKNKPIKRLWINSLEKDEIRKGFNNLKDGSETYDMYLEAQARQQADWLVGMNLSPLFSLVLQNKGFKGSLSIGRVQTPTVKLIYDRQRNIENFVPEKFYELNAVFQSENGAYKGKVDTRYNSKEEINKVFHKYELKSNDEGYIQSVKKKERKTKPPRLHSLSTLQTKANKVWKYSPSNTLKVVQGLYEKKVVTYPRTDSQYITENEFSYLVNNLDEYKRLANIDFKTSSNEPQKRYVDNSKVEEHYAIIPTKTIPNEKTIDGFTKQESNIYFEILKTTLGMFHHDYVYEETTIVTNVKNLEFKTSGTIEKQKGWKELSNEKKKKQDNKLPIVNQSEEVTATIETKEGKTTPPKPYTEGQLINLMKTAGKMVENQDESDILKEIEGIGTEATRASIIDRIKKQGFIEVRMNNVSVTEKGKVLCESVEDTLLSSPSMTAKWETYLQKIGNGKGNQQSFLNNTIKFIEKMIDEVPNSTNEQLNALIKELNKVDGIAECPSCKEQIIDKNKFYGCSGYSNGCKVSFPKKLAGKNITKSIVKNLCTKRETGKLKGFKSKKGKSFETRLLLNDKHEIKFNFD